MEPPYSKFIRRFMRPVLSIGILPHDLNVLLDKLKIILKQEFNSEAPDWFLNLVLAFHNSDPGGTTFRYGAELPQTELYCDMRHVKKVMGWFSVVFKRIWIEQEK